MMNISFLSLMMMIWIGIHKFNSIQFNCHYRISFSEFCCWNRFLFLLLLWILLLLVDSTFNSLFVKKIPKKKRIVEFLSHDKTFLIFSFSFSFADKIKTKNQETKQKKEEKRNFPGIEIENSNGEKIKKIRIRCLLIHYRI